MSTIRAQYMDHFGPPPIKRMVGMGSSLHVQGKHVHRGVCGMEDFNFRRVDRTSNQVVSHVNAELGCHSFLMLLYDIELNINSK